MFIINPEMFQKQVANRKEKLSNAELYCVICDKKLLGEQEVWNHTIKYHVRKPNFESIFNVHKKLNQAKKEIPISALDYFDALLRYWDIPGKRIKVDSQLILRRYINAVLLSPNCNQIISYSKVDEEFEFLTPQFHQRRLLEIEGKVKKIRDDLRVYEEMISPEGIISKEISKKLKNLTKKLTVLESEPRLSIELDQNIRELKDLIKSIWIQNESSKKRKASSKEREKTFISVLIESLVFEDRKVELIRKKGSVKFGLHSSKKVLNEFKNEYFGKQVFKFYLKNNQVIKEESPGYKLLEEKIQSYLIANKSNKNTAEQISIINRELDAKQIIELLKENAFRNKYLKEAAVRLKMETDFVVTFEENNNGSKEQGLFFVYKRTYKRNPKAFILYENGLENRAAYLFRVNEKYSERIIKDLVAFAQSDQRNKRESLFRERNDHLSIEGVNGWEVIKHDSIKNYKDKIEKVIL